MPELNTKTSSVYDYSIGTTNAMDHRHACLPIWYGQEQSITNKVIEELQKPSRG